MSRPRVTGFLVALLHVLLACGDGTAAPERPRPLVLSIVSGDRQTAEVGTPLPQPLIVRLADSAGVPARGVVVRLLRDEVAIDSGTTDGAGIASVRWTLGGIASDQGAVALADLDPEVHGRVAVLFTAHATPGPPAGIEIRGDGSVASPGSAVDTITALVADRFGNPAPDEPVAWLVKAGGGAVRPLESQTDSLGTAHAIWVLGPAEGGQVLEVSAATIAREISATASVLLSGTVVAVGASHSCALAISGAAYCWGDNSSGQLGIGRIDGESHPVPVPVAGGLRFTSIAAGGAHTCGVTAAHVAYCWGNSRSGQAGVGVVGLVASPTRVHGDLAFTAIAAGAHHTCGLTTERRAYCWGDNAVGQLGDGADRTTDMPVAGTGSVYPIPVAIPEPFLEIASGSFTNCAISSNGGTYCWGSNRFFEFGGQLDGRCYFIGTLFMYSGGPVPCSTQPVRIDGFPQLTKLTVSASAWCGRTANAQLVCWGNAIAVPRFMTNARVLDVWVAGNVVCAVGETGTIACWHGWLPGFPVLPTFGGDVPIGRLSSMGAHSCGISHDARSLVYCWGANDSGQLGNGTTTITLSVDQVLAPRGT